MTKLNQPFTLTLGVPHDLASLADAVSATLEYQKPDGSTGTWTGATLDTVAETVTYEVPANECDQVGTWRFIAVVTFSSGKVLPGEAFKHPIRGRFD
jgi:hypothetical protein